MSTPPAPLHASSPSHLDEGARGEQAKRSNAPQRVRRAGKRSEAPHQATREPGFAGRPVAPLGGRSEATGGPIERARGEQAKRSEATHGNARAGQASAAKPQIKPPARPASPADPGSPLGGRSAKRDWGAYCFTASTWINRRTSSGMPGRPYLTPYSLRLMVVSKSPPHTSRLSIGLV